MSKKTKETKTTTTTEITQPPVNERFSLAAVPEKGITLKQLHNCLSFQMLSIMDRNVSDRERAIRIAEARCAASLAKQMVNNANIVLNVEKMISTGNLRIDNDIQKIIG